MDLRNGDASLPKSRMPDVYTRNKSMQEKNFQTTITDTGSKTPVLEDSPNLDYYESAFTKMVKNRGDQQKEELRNKQIH